MQPRGTEYSDTAGLRLLAALPEAGVLRPTDALKAGHDLGLSEAHVRKLLHELARSGWLLHVQRGLYVQVDRATGAPRVHPYMLGTSLVEPSAVSHWSALSHWGLTEQIPQVVTVSTPRGSADRSRRRRMRAQDGALWSVGPQRYRVVFVQPELYFGFTEVWITPAERVSLFDRERAFLDAFRHFHIFGSLAPALEMLEQHLEELDLDKLVGYAARLGVISVSRRLGWALERLDAAAAPRARLAELVGTRASVEPLDPTRPEQGTRNRRWGVIENLVAV